MREEFILNSSKNRIIKRIWINEIETIDRELTENEKVELLKFNAPDQFWKKTHQHASKWRREKIKEISKRKASGKNVDFELELIKQFTEMKDM